MSAPVKDKELFRISAAGTGRRRRGGPVSLALRAAVPVIAALVVAIGLWLAVSYLLLSPSRRFLVPPPEQVLLDSFGNWKHLQPMLTALGLTAEVALVGLAIASALGIFTAVAMSQASWVERAVYPYAVVLQTVPILAIVPLIGLWFDYGFTSRVIVCVIIALFPMIANTLFGLHSASQGAHDLFTLNKATRWQRLTKLQLPAALPSIFTGLRTSSGLSVIGAIVGDFFFKQGEPGIGTLLDVYRARLQSTDLFAAIILASLFGIAVFAVFTALGKLVVGKRS
ncbi:ABC transporter permease [Amycolatopsis cynarae]|uniref:ABC transporter permease n=1 Tax=Amycolatopsis cynarae TaxID=2995223 RepID=A0ABY7AY47_9PSEU|nr:ABC transporter permease [Amycolatopsis sp. HUAS 11-8]WAL64398.1 ABC transporter permease [Amycolatopsis sp. HUAS 11-8]